MEIKIFTLADILTFEKKTSRRASEGKPKGKYLFFTSSPIRSKFIDNFDFEGEFLILGTGGNPSLHYYDKEFSTSADCLVLKSNSKSILTKYVYYYLLSNFYLLEEGFKGIGLKHISKEYLKKIKINIPPLNIQIERLKLFDKAEKLKEKIKLSEQFIDECLDNIFYDLFGDFEYNEKGWKKFTLPEIVENTHKNSIKRGPFGGSLKKEIFVNEGYLVYEQRHAIHNDFEYAKYYITKDKYDELKGFRVVPGDLIISCSGVTLGRISEIPENSKPGIINQALLKISLDKNKLNNEYFKFLFRSPGVQKLLFKVSRGSGIPNFPSISEIKKIEFPIPPIDLQNKFAEIVKKTEKIKERFNSNKNNYLKLFNSILNKGLNKKIIV